MTTALLDHFCYRLVEEVTPSKGLHPTVLAKEFVDFFGLSTFPRMEELVGLLNRAGVRTALCTHLPKGCRGVHTGTKKGSYLIEYDAFDWERAQEHTVLHELYEIVRERLHDLYPSVGKPQGRSLCRQADRFAAAALMQPEVFSVRREVGTGRCGPAELGGHVSPYERTATLRGSRRPTGPSPLTRHQVRHPHQVVGRSHQVPRQPRPLYSPIPGPSESSHRLHPPEHLLHPLPHLLARPVARTPCGATVYGRGCTPRHMGRHSPIAHGPDTLPGVVPLVSSQRPGTVPSLPRVIQHHGHSLTFRPARGPAHQEVHQQPVAVLHQRMAHE